MKMMRKLPTEEERFIPCTREIEIGNGIVYRPIRSWHSGNYAGEQLDEVDGDRSGCLFPPKLAGGAEGLTAAPLTVTHRLYWHRNNPEKTVSAFLSYPGGMGACKAYFWEILPGRNDPDDIDRYFSEDDMEQAIREIL
jgi:hypothetical protein